MQLYLLYLYVTYLQEMKTTKPTNLTRGQDVCSQKQKRYYKIVHVCQAVASAVLNWTYSNNLHDNIYSVRITLVWTFTFSQPVRSLAITADEWERDLWSRCTGSLCCWLMPWRRRRESLSVFLPFSLKSYSLQKVIYRQNTALYNTNGGMICTGFLEFI